MSERRVSQLVTEVASTPTAARRVSQLVAEVARTIHVQRRVSQLVVEVAMPRTTASVAYKITVN